MAKISPIRSPWCWPLSPSYKPCFLDLPSCAADNLPRFGRAGTNKKIWTIFLAHPSRGHFYCFNSWSCDFSGAKINHRTLSLTPPQSGNDLNIAIAQQKCFSFFVWCTLIIIPRIKLSSICHSIYNLNLQFSHRIAQPQSKWLVLF
jgi:hypothetical protein